MSQKQHEPKKSEKGGKQRAIKTKLKKEKTIKR
jgi:hypothetical protein